MSYILQALKRAQDERESGIAAPRPRAATVTGSLRRSWWPWAIAAALLVNAGALLVFSRSERMAIRVGSEGDGSREVPAAPERTTPASEGPSHRGPVAEPNAPMREATTPVPSESRDGGGRPRPLRPPRLTDSRATPGRATPAESRMDPPARRSEPAPRVGLTQPTESSPPAVQSPSSEPIPQTPPARASEPTPQTARAQSSEPIPRTAPMPYPASGSVAGAPAPASPSVREALQGLILQALVYADVRSQRMVFINGRKYVEGDTVAERFVLEQVTPEGAVLTANGERFVLRERGR